MITKREARIRGQASNIRACEQGRGWSNAGTCPLEICPVLVALPTAPRGVHMQPASHLLCEGSIQSAGCLPTRKQEGIIISAYAIPKVNDSLMHARCAAELHLRHDRESSIGVNLPGPRTGVEEVHRAPGEVDATSSQPTSRRRVHRPIRRCMLHQPISESCLACLALTPARFYRTLRRCRPRPRLPCPGAGMTRRRGGFCLIVSCLALQTRGAAGCRFSSAVLASCARFTSAGPGIRVRTCARPASHKHHSGSCMERKGMPSAQDRGSMDERPAMQAVQSGRMPVMADDALLDRPWTCTSHKARERLVPGTTTKT